MSVVVNGSNTPTAGGIGYGDGTNLAFSGAGTSGQFLSSGGSGAPTWVNAPSSAMTLISTLTANNTSPYLTWTNLSGYDTYIIYYKGILPASSGNGFRMQVGYGGTPTWVSSYYYTLNYYIFNGSGGGSGISVNQQSLGIAGVASGSIISPGANGQITITGALTGAPVGIIASSTGYETSIDHGGQTTYGLGVINNAVTAIRLFADSQSTNLASGKVSLYGISS